MPLFGDLTPGQLDLLLLRLVPVCVSAGEGIIRQGEQGERFYIMRQGEVKVSRNGEVVRTMRGGEAFGEIALILNSPRTATVKAVTQAELLTLSATDFQELLLRYLDRGGELEHMGRSRLEGDRATSYQSVE